MQATFILVVTRKGEPRCPLSSDPRLGTVRQAARLGSAVLLSLQLLTDCRDSRLQRTAQLHTTAHNSDTTLFPHLHHSTVLRSARPIILELRPLSPSLPRPFFPARAGNFQRQGVFLAESGPFSFFPFTAGDIFQSSLNRGLSHSFTS